MNDEGMASMGGGRGGVEGVVDLYQGEGRGTCYLVLLVFFTCTFLFFSNVLCHFFYVTRT